MLSLPLHFQNPKLIPKLGKPIKPYNTPMSLETEIFNLQRKVNQYKEVLNNTETYREEWKTSLRAHIKQLLEQLVEKTSLDAEVVVRSEIENLEAVLLTLGTSKSGMFQKVSEEIHRHLIKHNGSLVYQQLFNGKVIVLINYPFIENYGQPRPPKTIAIYRPEELKEPYFVRHMEEFVQEITNWEDYDDDEPNKRIGFQLNFSPDGIENSPVGETDD